METREKDAETSHTAISSQRWQILFTNFSTTTSLRHPITTFPKSRA